MPLPKSTSTAPRLVVRSTGLSVPNRIYVLLQGFKPYSCLFQEPQLTHCTSEDWRDLLALALCMTTLARSRVMDAGHGHTPGRASSGEDQADGGQWPSRSSGPVDIFSQCLSTRTHILSSSELGVYRLSGSDSSS
jgi:hypothetical protein